jgi:hypothetical protein
MISPNDNVMHELERLRADIADMQRRDDIRAPRVNDRIRAATGFLAGAVGTVALSTFITSLGAQTNTVSGCVTAGNSYLRITGVCAAGEIKLSLLMGDSTGKPASTPATRVTAPFEVVDEKGLVILRVTSAKDGVRGLKVFNENGQQVAAVTSYSGGGFMKVMHDGKDERTVTIVADADGSAFLLKEAGKQVATVRGYQGGGFVKVMHDGRDERTVTVVADGEGPAFLLKEAGKPRVTIGASATSGFALRVLNASGKLAGGIGHTVDGSGVMSIHDEAGTQRTVIDGHVGSLEVKNSQAVRVAAVNSSNNGKGEFTVYTNNVPIGVLTQGVNGALLQLGNTSGAVMVEAGTASNGVGIVRTGPMALPMLPGIPGSFILGKR